MKKVIIFLVIFMIGSMSKINAQTTGSFKDSRDWKTYKTIKIGTQTWMAENLAYKANSDCWAYDNNQSNVAKHGYLYNWEAAKIACPSGWHLPSDAEWTKLTNYIGGEDVAGKKLKSTMDWKLYEGKSYGNNESGFAALPSGCRIKNSFNGIGTNGYWWSSTPYPKDTRQVHACNRDLYYASNKVGAGYFTWRTLGFSVRCIKN